MATVPSRTRRKSRTIADRPANGKAVPLLHTGDRLTQREFHRRYEAYPEDVKFELVGGIVYMASPLGPPHGADHAELSGPFWLYKTATPGVQLLDNTTTILGEETETQPDLTLRILEEWGGRSRIIRKKYVKGPPEMLTEIAHSSKSLDLHKKKEDYECAGVLEYLVWCVEEGELHWFRFQPRGMITPDRDEISRSHVFPGLWLDGRALAERNSARLLEVIRQGIASPEHAAFVKKLEAARRKKK